LNTPTHFLITAAARRLWKGVEIPRAAVLLGSVAPDLPLFGLSIGGMLYFTRVVGLDRGEAARHIFGRLYFHDPIWISLHNILHSPTSLIIGLCVVHFFGKRRPRVANWLQMVQGWELTPEQRAEMIAKQVEIATSDEVTPKDSTAAFRAVVQAVAEPKQAQINVGVNIDNRAEDNRTRMAAIADGPLLLWPFEWTRRYSSPVSYWDHRHYGSVVWPLELLLDIGLGLWLLTPGLSALRKRFADRLGVELNLEHIEADGTLIQRAY